MKIIATTALAAIISGMFLNLWGHIDHVRSQSDRNSVKIQSNKEKIDSQNEVLLRIDRRVYDIHGMINERN
jgi:hypothetical protein